MSDLPHNLVALLIAAFSPTDDLDLDGSMLADDCDDGEQHLAGVQDAAVADRRVVSSVENPAWDILILLSPE